MTVYPLGSQSTNCPVTGCACRDRARSYPSDLTDAQWEVLRPEAEAVMAELRNGPGGGVMKHDLRAMLDAVGYVSRYGIEWRALPDFPPWPAAYAFFDRWSQRGLPQRLVDRLRGRIRVAYGRKETPTVAVIDSQSVKADQTVGAAVCGYDGGNFLGRPVMRGRAGTGCRGGTNGVITAYMPRFLCESFEGGERCSMVGIRRGCLVRWPGMCRGLRSRWSLRVSRRGPRKTTRTCWRI